MVSKQRQNAGRRSYMSCFLFLNDENVTVGYGVGLKSDIDLAEKWKLSTLSGEHVVAF